MKKSTATAIVCICLTILLMTVCLSLFSCQREASRTTERVEPALLPANPVETQTAEQKREAAAQAQSHLREQTETDRQQRINELMERARAYWKQQQYEAALGQLDNLLAIDPLNNEALTLQQVVQDRVYLRRAMEKDQLSAGQRTETLRQGDESSIPYADHITYPKNWRGITTGDPSPAAPAPMAPSSAAPPTQGMMGGMGGMRMGASEASIPYADEITYPKDWREVMQRKTRTPGEPYQLDPANVQVYKQLDMEVDLSQITAQTPLSTAIDIMRKSVTPPLNIVVFWRDLQENVYIEPTSPINMEGRPKVRLGTALDNLLKTISDPAHPNHPVDYTITNGVVTIATTAGLPQIGGTGGVSVSARPRSVLATARILAGLASVREDEIWVIARPQQERPQARGPQYDTPGSGAMLAQIQEKKVPLPLKHTDVKGKVCGYIATVEVVQQFQNPFGEKIEAVYVFPLPQNAAVNEFIMVIGQRQIRGIIRERQEAEQIYQEARRQGYVASLLTQERPNIFTQKVANIEPGKQIDVHIKYFSTLAYYYNATRVSSDI